MSKRAAVASRSRAALVALALLVPSLLLRSQPNESGFAESLKANVVAIRAAKTGFGFVVGERNGLLYIVTARHVVAPDTPDTAPPTPKLRFYADQGNTYDGRLLGTNDAAHDLAVISVQKPSVVQWNRQALAPSGLTTRGTRVWFVGRSDTWFVPVQPGTIVNEAPFRDHRIEADGLPVRVGTSGAPLVSASGIVGMIVTDGADDTRALSIEFIRTAFRDWAHPWNLEETKTGSAAVPADPTRREVASADLAYSIDVARWRIRGYRPASIDLSDAPPDARWRVPPPQGRQRLHGVLRFGTRTKVNVVVDVLDDMESQMIFAFDEDTSFVDKPVHRTVKGRLPRPVAFRISYGDGSTQDYAIHTYYPVEFAGKIGSYRLHYYTACVREGTISLGGTEYNLSVEDSDANGDYSDLSTTLLRIDGGPQDRKVIQSLISGYPFSVAGDYYVVSRIDFSGRAIAIKQAGYGWISGRVRSAKSSAPLEGAKVTLSPTELSTVTDSRGEYKLRAPEGKYFRMAATFEGGVPEYKVINRRVADGQNLTLDDIQLNDASAGGHGNVRLAHGESYHFLARQTSKYSGGDFYCVLSNGKARFFANNAYQQGVADLGDLGAVPLNQVEPPPNDKYYKFGVDAIVGHTYVSPAKAGEEGHYVVFRVTNVNAGEYVELEYYYR